MRCLPDLFQYTSGAGRLERLWSYEAECLADARAAGASPERAAHLASAVIKVARLAEGVSPAPVPAWSPFHEPGCSKPARLVASRAPAVPPETPRFRSRLLVAALVAGIGIAWRVGVPHSLHALTERLIAGLP